MINVNTKVDNTVPEDVATVRSRKENVFMQGLRGIQQVLKDHAKIIDQRNKFF